jgi:hypothetical protein
MHCFIKLKKYEKLRQARLQMNKASNIVIDVDAPLATLAGRPIGDKKPRHHSLG